MNAENYAPPKRQGASLSKLLAATFAAMALGYAAYLGFSQNHHIQMRSCQDQTKTKTQLRNCDGWLSYNLAANRSQL